MACLDLLAPFSCSLPDVVYSLPELSCESISFGFVEVGLTLVTFSASLSLLLLLSVLSSSDALTDTTGLEADLGTGGVSSDDGFSVSEEEVCDVGSLPDLV